jgi:hypothetical protein
MSRVVTPPTAKPVTPPAAKPATPQQFKIPQDKIAKRAYEKWAKRGYGHGRDQQDWLEAEAELRTEYGYTAGNAPSPGRR